MNKISDFKYWSELADLIGMLPISDRGNKITSEAFIRGYYIGPEVDGAAAQSFLNGHRVQQSTFWQDWRCVQNKSEEELFIAALIHYFGKAAGIDIHPARTQIAGVPINMKDLKEIKGASLDQITEAIYKLCDGPLKEESTYYICTYLIWNLDNASIQMDRIGNRELQCRLYKELNIWPVRGEDIVRQICYLGTGSPLLIKSRDVIRAAGIVCLSDLNDDQIRELARVWNRYKPILLSCKRYNGRLINRISRLSKTLHKPLKPDFWKTLTQFRPPLYKVQQKSQELAPYELVRLINMCSDHLAMYGGCSDSLYLIRNQKIYYKTAEIPPLSSDVFYLEGVKKILYDRLIEKMKQRAQSVVLPSDIELACPVSMKNFVGDFPFGSYVTLPSNNSVIGIYWKGEDGAEDLDLSVIDSTGEKIGWDSVYKNNEYMFSGDMTVANPDAAEALFIKHPEAGVVKDSLFFVNRYDGQENSKYKFFISTEETWNPRTGYIPDQYDGGQTIFGTGKLLFQADMFSQSREDVVGLLTGNKFYMCKTQSSNKITSCTGTAIVGSLKRSMQTKLMLRQMLEDAGFKILKRVPKYDKCINLRSNLNPQVLMDLFK